MAIFHNTFKALSRSDGRSATAAAAYRGGCVVADDLTGEVHDYSRKGGVVSSHILVPECAPDWARDSAQLWNKVEQAEKRKNSTIARENIIALPAELSADERQQLALDYARQLMLRHGCAVEVFIHEPGGEGDERNHHAHILMSTRRLTPDGFGEKCRELDDRKSGSELVTHWREQWADLANAALERAGSAERIDHRSHAERGLTEVPSTHLGAAVTDMLRQGKPSEVSERIQAQAAAAAQAQAEAQAAARDLAKAQQLLDAAQEQAAHEAAEQRRRSDEYQRLLKMDSRSLLAEVKRMRERLPSVQSLVERDPEYQAAQRRVYQVDDQLEKAQAQAARAVQAVADWREVHKIRTWAHDRGVLASPLVTLEGRAEAAAQRVHELAPAVQGAQRRLSRQQQLSERAALGQLAPHRESLDRWYARALQLQQREREAERQERQAQRQGQDEQQPAQQRSRPRHRGM